MSIIDFLINLIPLLLSAAFLTLMERKLLALYQKRRGPNVVGLYGLLQPIADGIKLLLKELVIPSSSNKILFMLSPLIVFFIVILSWSFIPFNNESFYLNFDLGILFIFVLSTLNVYGIILAGWSSNSKYAFLGSVRAIAQMLSYEVVFIFSMFPIILIVGTMNFIDVVIKQESFWFIFLFPISAFNFFIVILAETNRTPFDLPEAEGELVSGFNVEYSSMSFALFSLSEYASIILMSSIFCILFLGGWGTFSTIISVPIFSLKISLIVFLIISVRAFLPRYRFDQLIELGWRIILPICLGYYTFILSILYIELFC
jgi:NADH:ubiquinone oxidoreductase subunit H